MARPRTLLLAGVAIAALATTAAILAKLLQTARPSLPAGVTREEYNQYADQCKVRNAAVPDRIDVLVTVGDAAFVDGRLATALACYEEIPSDSALYGAAVRLEQAKVLIQLNRAREAEQQLHEFLRLIDQGHTHRIEQAAQALDLLRFLLEVELRFEERQKILQVIHRLHANSSFDTLAYCFPSVLRWNGEQAVLWLENFWKEDPNDPWLRVALGRYRAGQGRLEEAQAILEECCRELPESRWAHAALVACYYEQGDWESVARTLEQLPPLKPSEPWLLLRMRGHYHNHVGEYAEAMTCFQHALRADPPNAESLLGLATAHAGLGQQDEQREALRKAGIIARIQNRTGWVQTREDSIEPVLEIVSLCEEIDLGQQALMMARLALKMEPDNGDVRQIVERLESANALQTATVAPN